MQPTKKQIQLHKEHLDKLTDQEVEELVKEHAFSVIRPSGETIMPSPWLADDHLTDSGNAVRFAFENEGKILYCDPWSGWLIYDGKRWRKDDTRALMKRAHLTIRSFENEIQAYVKNDKQRREILEFLIRSESAMKLRNMVTLAQDKLPVVPRQLDKNQWLLNVNNGTLDLKDIALREHSQEDLITKLAPVDYDPGARCPLWDDFLVVVTQSNEDLIRFIQKAIGYSLTGDISEQVLFILYGTGANGKSTFVRTVSTLLGDYAKQTPAETLLLKHQENISNDLARLKGTRFLSAIESESNRKLAESLVKQMTGSDKIVARFLYGEFFEYYPEFKVFLATNHKPIIRGTDYAIWRRIRLIPFSVKIPEESQDKNLFTKLQTELPGILNWALEGLKLWQEEGLKSPKVVKEATSIYQNEMDTVARFLEECCISDRGVDTKTSNTALYEAYIRWARDNGEREMSSRNFGNILHEKDFTDRKTNQGKTWFGIGLVQYR